MNPKPVPQTKLWHVPDLSLELLHAENQTHVFPKHIHEHYALGVIEQGALGFFYRGEYVVASPSEFSLCIPGEPHTGQPALAEGWSYRMFYIDPQLLTQVASEMAGKERTLPFFVSGVIDDRALAKRFCSLHRQMECFSGSSLEHETKLLNALGTFIERYADDIPPKRRVGQESKAVNQIKEYFGSHFDQNITLAELSLLTELSRYHLVRSFHQAVGVPPHAYLRQVRVAKAKQLLVQGQTLAEAAISAGFTDQSHLSRWFKRYWGVTPGQYRNSVQDGSA